MIESVTRVRDLCHEATRSGEASPLVVAALELAEECERMERTMMDVGEKIDEIDVMLEAVR